MKGVKIKFGKIKYLPYIPYCHLHHHHHQIHRNHLHLNIKFFGGIEESLNPRGWNNKSTWESTSTASQKGYKQNSLLLQNLDHEAKNKILIQIFFIFNLRHKDFLVCSIFFHRDSHSSGSFCLKNWQISLFINSH